MEDVTSEDVTSDYTGVNSGFKQGTIFQGLNLWCPHTMQQSLSLHSHWHCYPHPILRLPLFSSYSCSLTLWSTQCHACSWIACRLPLSICRYFAQSLSLITPKTSPSLHTCIQHILSRYMHTLPVIQSTDPLCYTTVPSKSQTWCLSLCQQVIGSEGTSWWTISLPELHPSQKVTPTTLIRYMDLPTLVAWAWCHYSAFSNVQSLVFLLLLTTCLHPFHISLLYPVATSLVIAFLAQMTVAFHTGF